MNTEAALVIRTGCLSCRARGVRCDPRNPQCRQNSSTRWTTNRSLQRQPRGTRDHRNAPILENSLAGVSSLDSIWSGTQRERQSLHFFSVISAPELSGLLDSNFWQRLLLQATHQYSAIKHAVAAIGACHEHKLRQQVARINAETDALPPFALRQCNKAISSLIAVGKTKKADQQGLMSALTASVLFACFEQLSGNRQRAVPHVIHSRRLLEQSKRELGEEYLSGQSADFPIHLDAIEPLITHYECQVGDFIMEANPEGMTKSFDVEELLSFGRLADARVSLEKGIANVGVEVWKLETRHSPNDIHATELKKSQYRTWFQKWDRAFSAFLSAEAPNMDRSTLEGCRVLKAHHLAASTLARVAYGKGEEVWSEFTPEFSAIVDLISEVIKSLPKKAVTSQPPQTPYLSTSMGMTEPLYCALSRCTDAEIVKRARALINKLPLSEGIHSTWKKEYIEAILCAATGKQNVRHEPS